MKKQLPTRLAAQAACCAALLVLTCSARAAEDVKALLESWNEGWYQVTDQTTQTMANRNNDVTMMATGLTWSPNKELDVFFDYAQASRQSGATGAFTLYDKWVPDTGTGGNASASVGYSESKKSQSGISLGALYRF